MARYLIKQVETYRVDNENDAKKFIEEQKASDKYEIVKYTSEHKETKAKGEVIDEWTRVTLTKVFQSEKEPVIEASYLTTVEEVEHED